MSKKPLISVYITTQNRSSLLKRAVESVLSQTWTNIEVIVCDDASNDETQELLKQFTKADNRLKVITNPEVLGACHSRNNAIKAASGEYITGLDDDDYFLPNRLETLFNAFDSKYAFVCSTYYRVTQKSKRLVKDGVGVITLNHLLHYNKVGNQVLTKTRRLIDIGGFDPSLPAFQDYDTWVRLLEKHGPALKVNTPLYVFDTSHENERISGNNNKIKRGFELFLEKHRRLMTRRHLDSMELLRLFVHKQNVPITKLVSLSNTGNFKSILSYLLKREKQFEISSNERHRISVIIPVYNAETYVKEAIESILNQSHKNIEVIIIDDGSSDDSLNILKELAVIDKRIKLVSRENKGLIYTLNEAISISTGEFIARMDADDVSTKNRFKAQLAFLLKHRDVAVVGTGYKYIDHDGNVIGQRNITTQHDEIMSSFYFGNPIAHPSVMINRKLVGSALKYDMSFSTIEDLALWNKLGQRYKLANIKDTLLHYRVLEQSISGKNIDFQLNSAAKLLASTPPLSELEDGLETSKLLYSFNQNNASFYQFLRACVKLNKANFKTKTISPYYLLKRTVKALLSTKRKALRN